ncbi:MAG: tyrosine-type recombinase/integrase [Propioniciclava sp.]|uniref:site-specific integrase n=1 Tax=Propioniciclava sp. TaxID=2038686 RepID=UPI0039E2F1E4
MTGTYIDPARAKMTVDQWCDEWLEGYGTRRASTVRKARVDLKRIRAKFGPVRLSAIRPSHVRAWTAELSALLAPSTVYATYRRFAQLMSDAVHDGLIPKSPCSRKTSPGQPKPRPYVATTAQVWALYDAFSPWLRSAVLLGAFAGLRTAEAVAVDTRDADFASGVITPSKQYPDEPLKSETSKTPIPIPSDLSLMLAASVREWCGEKLVTDMFGKPVGPWVVEREMRKVRAVITADPSRGLEPLPEGFRFHDLRHYYASLLIAAGLDIKTVQTRLRHASATTTLNIYGHMFPDKDESARAAVAAAFGARADSLRTQQAAETA